MKLQGLRRVVACSALALFLTAMSPPRAAGAIAVGDTPTIVGEAVGGGQIDLKKLRGKLVLIDFWATWCGPCMDQMPHLVEVNAKYGSKGLQIIGISQDKNAAAVPPVLKANSMTWPIYIDADDQVANQFGVNGIPHLFLIGPSGAVIWDGGAGGAPQALDAAIEKAFRETPPQFVDPKVLAMAQDKLGEVEKMLAGGDAAGALKVLSRVPAGAKADEDFAAKLAAVSEQLGKAADKMLADVEPQIEQKKYVEAIAKLKELSVALADLPAGDKAKRRLAQVQAMPEVKRALGQAQRERLSGDALAIAKKLKASGKHELAYPRFREVAKRFPGTAAAKEAAAAVKAYERDADFVQRVAAKEAGAKAKGALNMARAYARNGRHDQARKKYQGIIDEFPETPFAETAKQELAALEGK